MLHLLLAVALSKLYAVHIDTPTDRAALEKADRGDAVVRKAFYQQHGIALPKVVIFTTADGTLYTLRGRDSLADFAKPSSLTPEQRKELEAKTAETTELAHHSLRMHHNEVWELDAETTVPGDGHAPKYARLIVEQVRPAMETQYDAALRQVHDAVAKTKGVALLAFYSAYGDGACRYLVLSDEPVDLYAVVPPDVRKQWQDAVVESKVIDATPRPDLTATDPGSWY